MLYPGCIPSGLFAASDLLEAANQLVGERFFKFLWVGDHEILETGVHSSNVNRHNGIKLYPELDIREAELDAVLIPGMWIRSLAEMDQNLTLNQNLSKTLSTLEDRIYLHGYCTSVSFIAKTGRLDHRQATSTWWLSNYFVNGYKNVDWDFSKTFVQGANFTCASGVNGYLPTAMHLVEKHLGSIVLRNVTKVMLLPKPEPVQQPFQKVDLLALNDDTMRKIHVWVESRPASELTTAELAKALHVSERTLFRKVKAATGESTMGFMRLIKLNQASEELILTNRPVSSISNSAGYSDDRTFRRIFKKVTGYTPLEYRQTFKRPNLES